MNELTKKLIESIAKGIKHTLDETKISNTDEMTIDTSRHSEDRFERQYHKSVSEDDLKNTLIKLYNRLYTAYRDGDLKNESNVVIIDKKYHPNFNIVCDFIIRNNKITLKVITEIFKNNFIPKNKEDYIITIY